MNSSREPSIRVVMMPKDTNAHGTIFGGVILSYIDQAAAVEAKQHGADFVVTVAMREVIFHEPVYVGDLVRGTHPLHGLCCVRLALRSQRIVGCSDVIAQRRG